MFIRSLVIVTAALVAPVMAHAQSAIVLWPTDPKIVAGENATALWLENHGKQAVTLQVRARDWDQADGTDREQTTQEIVSSPPIATIEPGQRQLVRVIRRGPTAPGEQAYRLLIDELPQTAPTGEGVLAARLAVQMRYSLPLFTYGGTAGAAPRLTSRVRLIDGRRWVEITNSGTGHARLTNLRSGSGASARTLQGGLVGYVLPGSTMRWALPDDLAATSALVLSVNGSDTPLATTA